MVFNPFEQKDSDMISSSVCLNKDSSVEQMDQDGFVTMLGPNKEVFDVGLGLKNTHDNSTRHAKKKMEVFGKRRIGGTKFM